MTETIEQTGFTQETFEAFLAARDEPEWMTRLRRDCFETYQSLPLPSHRDEEWMRTDVRLLRLDRYAPPVVDLAGAEDLPAQNLPPATLAEGLELAGHSASLDSRPVTCDLDRKWRDAGVLLGPMEKLLAEHAERIGKSRPFGLVDPSVDKFAALHGAFSSGGTLLYVPRGVCIEQPLHLQSAMSDGGVDFSHTLVVLEEGAEATVLAESSSTSETGGGLHTGAVELVVGPNAKLRYVNLQNWGSGVWHFAHQTARVDRDAQLQWTIGALGSKLAKVNQHVHLSGEYARAQVNGVMFTQERQHLSYHTLQHHEAPNCPSDLLYKGGLQDRSRIVWRGMIRVDEAAQRTDGYQRNDNLMLSNHSRSDSIPGLEIEADDVRCTHGSTTGRVNDEQLFYAQCRGLTRKEAVRMIVAGFFQQVFDRITIDSVREALGQAIGRRIREYD